MMFDLRSLLTPDVVDRFVAGSVTTLELFLSSLSTGLVIASLLVSLREIHLKFVDWAVTAFVDYHRNVPALVQLFVWYFGISQLLPQSMQDWVNDNGSEFFFAYVALSLNSGAYMSEDLRSGLRSVARGQNEASRALGMTFWQTMRDVLLPQAFRASFPPLVSQSLSLFKSTSLAMAIGVADLTYIGRQVESETFRTFETFAVVSILYLTGSWLITILGYLVERRLRRAEVR